MKVLTAKQQLWAWLFSQGMTIKKVRMGDQLVDSGLSQKDVFDAVDVLLPPIIDRIIMSFDWDFAVDVATTTTVSGTSEYELEGNSGDCRDIISVRYGDGRGTPIEEKVVADMDRREAETVSGAADAGGVYAYTRFGRSDQGYPQIQLFDTPLEAKTLTYRYRKNGLTIESIPDEFGFVVRDFLRAEYRPEYESLAETRLNDMIARYEVGGDSPKTVRMHPTIEAGNIRRESNQGGC